MTRGVQGFLTVIVCLLVGAGAVGFAVGQSTDTARQSAATPDILATLQAVVDATPPAQNQTAPSMLSRSAAAGQPAVQQSVAATPVPQQVARAPLSAQPVAQAAINPLVQQRTGLTIQEVMRWCTGTGCTADHFQPLPETSGIINPNGVLFMITVADQASDFNVPSGITVDPWNCVTPSPRLAGPVHLTHICQASFRKG